MRVAKIRGISVGNFCKDSKVRVTRAYFFPRVAIRSRVVY